jgi:hypothetical protein
MHNCFTPFSLSLCFDLFLICPGILSKKMIETGFITGDTTSPTSKSPTLLHRVVEAVFATRAFEKESIQSAVLNVFFLPSRL